jgi:predicted phage-related endonuclease
MSALPRSSFLGATDAAPVLGVSPYLSAVELWQEKTGRRAPRHSDPDVARVLMRGRTLEPFIREMTIEKLRDDGHRVDLIAANQRYFDEANPFLSCEIDFELLVDGVAIDVDAKSVNSHARSQWGEPGTGEIPLPYLAQAQAQMMIRRRPRVIFAALRSFDDVDLYPVNRDDTTIEGMRGRMVEFWQQHVERDVPPDPLKFSDVRALFPKAQPKNIEATPAIVKKVQQRRELLDQLKDVKTRIDGIEFELAQFMGPHALLTHGVRNLISWDNESRETFDGKAFKRAHPDWAALYIKQTTHRVMRTARKRA